MSESLRANCDESGPVKIVNTLFLPELQPPCTVPVNRPVQRPVEVVHKLTPSQRKRVEHSEQWEKVYKGLDDRDDLSFTEMSELVEYLRRGDRLYG